MEKQKTQEHSGQTVIVNQVERQTNGIGTAGFVLAIIAIVLSWVPCLGVVLWLLGAIFSFVGVLKEPRGLSIAGLAISLIGLLILIVVAGSILNEFSSLGL